MTEKALHNKKRIVFFGSDVFSLPTLETLCQGPDEVVLVVSNPPAPCGRGRKMKPSPVAAYAAEKKLNLFESRSVRSPEAIERIRSAQPDFMVVSAFGGFLPKELLDMCSYPPLNVHPSLLPLHRGPAPVSWAILKSDKEIGVSIIFLEQEMDAGPILCQRSFPLNDYESAGQWEDRLAKVGAKDLLSVIEQLKQGCVEAKEQNSSQATVNRLLKKADGIIDWTLPANELCSLINGVDPWPGAQSLFQGKNLKIFGARPEKNHYEALEAGRVLGLDQESRLLVLAGEGSMLSVAELQPEGKKRMSAADFVRGYKPEMLGK